MRLKKNIRVPSEEACATSLDHPVLGTGAKPSHAEHQIFHLILCAATEEGSPSNFMRLNERFFIRQNYQDHLS